MFWDLSSQLTDLIRSFKRLMMFVCALYFSRMASRRSTNSFRCPLRKFAVFACRGWIGGVHVYMILYVGFALLSTVFGWNFAFGSTTINTHLGGLDLQSHKNTQQGWMKRQSLLSSRNATSLDLQASKYATWWQKRHKLPSSTMWEEWIPIQSWKLVEYFTHQRSL